MKIFTLLCIVLAIALVGCSLVSISDKVKGSGVVKTEKRSVASFSSLDIACYGSIEVRSQGQTSFEINGDDNIIPLITTEVRDNTLFIRSSKEYDSRDKLKIIVSTADLKRLVFSGAGEATLANVKNDRLELVLSGAGSLSASGETKDADITLSGAGSVDARNLHSINAKVNSSGVGSVEVYATGQLDARTGGIGEINYYGSPKTVNRQAGGLGSINER
jgi:hypothetical protein